MGKHEGKPKPVQKPKPPPKPTPDGQVKGGGQREKPK